MGIIVGGLCAVDDKARVIANNLLYVIVVKHVKTLLTHHTRLEPALLMSITLIDVLGRR